MTRISDSSHLVPPEDFEGAKRSKIGKSKKVRKTFSQVLFDAVANGRIESAKRDGEDFYITIRLAEDDVIFLEQGMKKRGKYKVGMLVEARIEKIEFKKIRVIPN